MDLGTITGIASTVGVVIGMVIWQMRAKKESEAVQGRLLDALRGAPSVTVPELVAAAGLKDGFMSRGKVIQWMSPLVAAGTVVEEPDEPGVTVKDRLERKRFSLKR
jgi:hypothetical protein